MNEYRNPRTRDVPEKITQYLGNGGLFNPELMDHESVRDLLIHARDVIEIFERERSQSETKADAAARDTMMVFARYILRHCNYDRLRDHACPRCMPEGGDLVVPDFVCAYHLAESYVGAQKTVVPTASASTDGGAFPSRTSSPSVECPKCRTQLAFEGDVCGLCQ